MVLTPEAEESRAKDSAIEPTPFSNNESGSLSSCSGKGSLATGNSQRTQCYRTKLCKFFEQSLCDRGDSCTYAHSEEQLRQAPNLRKTKLCNQWQHNKCPHQSAATCPYAHGPNDLRCEIDPLPLQPSSSSTPPSTPSQPTSLLPQNETLTLSPSLTNSTSASTSELRQNQTSPSLRSLSSSISSTVPWALSKTNCHSQDIGNISKSCLAPQTDLINNEPYYSSSSGSEKNLDKQQHQNFPKHHQQHHQQQNHHVLTEELFPRPSIFFNGDEERFQDKSHNTPVLNQFNTAGTNYYESNYSNANISNLNIKTPRDIASSTHANQDEPATQDFLDDHNIIKRLDEVNSQDQQSNPVINSMQEMAGASPFYLSADWDFTTIMSASSYRLTITAQFIHPYDD